MPLLLHVDLVSGDDKADLGAQHLAELLHPVLHLGEAVRVSDVVNL